MNQEDTPVHVAMGQPAPELFEHWERLREKYLPFLNTHKKTGVELLTYLKSKYPLKPECSDRAIEVGRFNAMEYLRNLELLNEFPSLDIMVFKVLDRKNGAALYRTQQEDYQKHTDWWRFILKTDDPYFEDDLFPLPIYIFLEKNSGFAYVEGSPRLGDEIELFLGHNEKELENSFLAAYYIELLKRYDQLPLVP